MSSRLESARDSELFEIQIAQAAQRFAGRANAASPAFQVEEKALW